jgi:hypothetical protein
MVLAEPLANIDESQQAMAPTYLKEIAAQPKNR